MPIRWAVSAIMSGFSFMKSSSICLIEEKFCDQQPNADATRRRNETRQHERMVQKVFPDSCCAGTIKLHRGDECAIIRDEKIAVHGGEHANERGCRNAQ